MFDPSLDVKLHNCPQSYRNPPHHLGIFDSLLTLKNLSKEPPQP